MSYITPSMEEMEHCSCSFLDKVKTWQPEFENVYETLQSDLKEFNQGRVDTESTRLFEAAYLKPVYKALGVVKSLIQDEAPITADFMKAWKEFPNQDLDLWTAQLKDASKIDPEAMAGRIFFAGQLVCRLAYSRTKTQGCSLSIHHSFKLTQGPKPEMEIKDGESAGGVRERENSLATSGPGSYRKRRTHTERFGFCLAPECDRVQSLHDPTADRSIDQSFFQDDAATVWVTTWDCEDPKPKKKWTTSSFSRAKQLLAESKYVTAKFYRLDPPGPSDESTRPIGSISYALDYEDKKDITGEEPSDVGDVYYSWMNQTVLNNFLKGLDRDMLDNLEAGLELHHGTLKATSNHSGSILSKRRPDLTTEQIQQEVDRPAAAIEEILNGIRSFRSLEEGSLGYATSASSGVYD
ncbi:hypothetical protein NCC49_005310 [Naganishia albida]|nr:hypothetical protein NCC49_005310 [Naganishia albida]